MKLVKILSKTLLIASCLSFCVNAARVDKEVDDQEIRKAAVASINAITQSRLNESCYQNILCSSWSCKDAACLSKTIARGANMDYTKVSSLYINLVELFDQGQKSKRGMVIFLKNAHEYLGPRDCIQEQQNIQFINAFLLLTLGPSKKVIFILHTDDKNNLDEAVISRMSRIIY